MNTLQKTREDLASVLASAGFRSLDYVPDNVQPPFAAVEHGSPYLDGEHDDARPFGSFGVNYRVFLMLKPGKNEKETDELDAAIVKTLVAFRTSRQFHVVQVEKPVTFVKDTAAYPAVYITVTAGDIKIKEEV